MPPPARIGCQRKEFPSINRRLNEEGLMAHIVQLTPDLVIFTVVKRENFDAHHDQNRLENAGTKSD